jgi:hypothetical protein
MTHNFSLTKYQKNLSGYDMPYSQIMKFAVIFFIIVSFAVSPFIMQYSFAQCFINEDWPQAPCLDHLINGCYDSDDVKTWMKYYDYKGESFMESKKSEMADAFEANRLSEWESRSSENFNVWQYYYLNGEIPGFGGGYYRCNEQFVPEVEILPSTKVTYGDSFTIHAWLSDYGDKPENLRFFVDVVDSHSNQVDSTLWFARQDFVYEFDTTHPAYNITEGGTYKIKIEHANQMQRTGFFYKTLEFEIDFPDNHLSPLKQTKSGIYGNDIQCRDERVLVMKKSSELYSCVKPETAPKLFARNWALNEVEIIETDTVQQDSKLIKITGVIDRRLTPEGFEYHLIPLHEELPRIEYTGHDTLNLFSTKDTVHYFLRNIEGSLVNIEGKFLLDDGDYFKHYSGFPTIPVQKFEVISESESIEYSIEGAEFLSITKIPDAMTLNIVILEAENGVLEITIPRELFDATIGGEDEDFFVVVDGFEVDFTENGNSVERTLTIQFEEGARTIEIIGTFPI